MYIFIGNECIHVNADKTQNSDDLSCLHRTHPLNIQSDGVFINRLNLWQK